MQKTLIVLMGLAGGLQVQAAEPVRTGQATGQAASKTPARPSAPVRAAVAHKPTPYPVAPIPSVANPGQAAAEPGLSPEALQIAQRVHHGRLACELGASVQVEPDAAQPGYFFLSGKGFRYRMHPVSTSTGAIRLEDQRAGAVWLQLANKSMLMDQKQGRRLADECAHPEQMAYAEQMKHNPPPPLIEVHTGR